MHWVLQEGFVSEAGWEELIATLERFGISYSVHHVVPRVGNIVPDLSIDHNNIICIGSYAMRHVASRQGWIPGVFDLFAYDFKQQRLHWGEHLLNFHSTVCTLEHARFALPKMFVRPIHDSKHFSGRVFNQEDFVTWQRSICESTMNHNTSLTPQTKIQLSRPISIYAEYRFWIVGDEIVTQSLYKRGGQVYYHRDVDEPIASFARARVNEWAPHEAFVIDICNSELGVKIVEINTINSSGFYAADVQRLVLKLEERFTQ
ncbi:ATP-grasp domain-containing protein [Calothrix sp. 336/3]|uniref:ATP-grasp domain-containing protein n=1 Tax=Calothrix sp. 336/3 TaxID=1337936 RepID=UPI0004E34F80|nr:ATP-grasp domain-containing protein [Calothrix sp. 336/3]AKG23038.1 hypothetical protein IJ00_18770 [Calothrix sp. 336/3]